MTTAKTNKAEKRPKTPKTPRSTKPKPETAPERKLSALAAAAQVLAETGEAMTCPELIAAMAAKGYWSSPAGKTPAATLSAAMNREIKLKGAESRFKKWTVPGKYVAAAVVAEEVRTPAPKEPTDGKAKKPVSKKGAKRAKPAKLTKTTKSATAEAEAAKPAAVPDGTPGPESVAELFRV